MTHKEQQTIISLEFYKFLTACFEQGVKYEYCQDVLFGMLGGFILEDSYRRFYECVRMIETDQLEKNRDRVSKEDNYGENSPLKYVEPNYFSYRDVGEKR